MIWQLISDAHCSFRAKTATVNFCRNEYNLTGLCNRASCPLANSQYATVREHDGRVYLYMKTIERAHTPKKLWQRILLKRNYAEALEQIDRRLAHWPEFLVHKAKQRFTKITQYLIRARKLALKSRAKLTTLPARQKKQLARKELKAEVAAQIDTAIEKELMARLQAGTYGDIYNFRQEAYDRVLAKQNAQEEDEEIAEDEAEFLEAGSEDEDEEDEEEEEESELEEELEDVSDFESSDEEEDIEDARGREGASSSDDDDDNDDESSGDEEGASARRGAKGPAGAARGAAGKARRAAAPSPAAAKGKRRRGRVEIEYEEERESARSRH